MVEISNRSIDTGKTSSYRQPRSRCAVHWNQFSGISGINCAHIITFILVLVFECFSASVLPYFYPKFVAKKCFFQVSEFSPSTSSAMGLPREFHEQCRASLELDYLKVLLFDINIIFHCIQQSSCIPCSTAYFIIFISITNNFLGLSFLLSHAAF